MLLSIKRLCGKRLIARDTAMGTVQDFYFDDQKWGVRYVVAHTGAWLPGRLVLIAPHAFEPLFQRDDGLLMNLSRQQIQDSPEIASHKQVSRRYEEEYHRHYNWPPYWNADEMWGIGGLPVARPPRLKPVEQTHNGHSPHKAKDSQLHSAKSLRNYRVQSEIGEIGHVIDFMMEEESWKIRQIIVNTDEQCSGKEIAISPEQIDFVSCDESRIFVTMSHEAIENGVNTPYHSSPTSVL